MNYAKIIFLINFTLLLTFLAYHLSCLALFGNKLVSPTEQMIFSCIILFVIISKASLLIVYGKNIYIAIRDL